MSIGTRTQRVARPSQEHGSELAIAILVPTLIATSVDLGPDGKLDPRGLFRLELGPQAARYLIEIVCRDTSNRKLYGAIASPY